MAAYNAEKTIKYAVDSVLSQSFQNWELLIIDDASSDHTRDILNCYKDSRIKIIENNENLGVSRTRKVGADIAQGEWIAVLDSDDMWRSDKLEKQIELAKKTKGKLFFTASTFMDDSGNQINYILHVPAVLTYRQLLKQNLISNSSVMVNKELYRKYYAIGDKMHEDYAIWLKITKEGIHAFGIDEPLLIYRLTESSKSSNKVKAAKMNWNTLKYCGVSKKQELYYMGWYCINGLRKYIALRMRKQA